MIFLLYDYFFSNFKSTIFVKYAYTIKNLNYIALIETFANDKTCYLDFNVFWNILTDSEIDNSIQNCFFKVSVNHSCNNIVQ